MLLQLLLLEVQLLFGLLLLLGLPRSCRRLEGRQGLLSEGLQLVCLGLLHLLPLLQLPNDGASTGSGTTRSLRTSTHTRGGACTSTSGGSRATAGTGAHQCRLLLPTTSSPTARPTLLGRLTALTVSDVTVPRGTALRGTAPVYTRVTLPTPTSADTSVPAAVPALPCRGSTTVGTPASAAAATGRFAAPSPVSATPGWAPASTPAPAPASWATRVVRVSVCAPTPHRAPHPTVLPGHALAPGPGPATGTCVRPALSARGHCSAGRRGPGSHSPIHGRQGGGQVGDRLPRNTWRGLHLQVGMPGGQPTQLPRGGQLLGQAHHGDDLTPAPHVCSTQRSAQVRG